MSSSHTEPLVDIVMPAMGTSVSEGTVTEWRKAVGDPIARDENVCEVSSDKVDVECPAPVAGVLRELLVAAGETVDVGTPLGRIAVAVGDSDVVAAVLATNGNGNGSRTRATPVVKRMVAIHDLDLATIEGSGRHGRVTKKDVEAHMRAAADRDGGEERPLHSESPYRPDLVPGPAPSPSPIPPPAGRPRQLSRMRQSIGRAMRNSLATAATCTTIVECDMSAVERARAQLGVTALPVVAARVIETLREFGALNATLDGDTMTLFEEVHLGIAVSLGEDGLVVPVARDAQNLSVEGLSRTIRTLAGAARARELGPDDFAGATFTLTSPGAFGALIATPVINVPQVGILDMEAITRRPVVVCDEHGRESIAIRSMTYFCLSWDHRAIDGAYAARFLTALRGRVETP